MNSRKLRAGILFFIMVTLGLYYIGRQYPLGHLMLNRNVDKAQPVTSPVGSDYMGEKITYDIKMGMVTLGSASFQNIGKTQIEGKELNKIVFETKLARFYDKETIFTDTADFLPRLVMREIRMWPNYETIREEYDQTKFLLRITKNKDNAKEAASIQKSSPIHNAILLPYFVRRVPDLGLGWSMKINLPTQELELKLVSYQQIKVPAGKFKTFYFESVPKRINIWISADERRIPVKMTGTSGINYTLVMRQYHENDAQ